MTSSIQDMTPQQRLRAAAIILRDAAEKQDAEEAERAARDASMAVAS